MKRIIVTLCFVLIFSSLSFADFDETLLNKGIIGVNFKTTEQGNYKILIEHDKQKISYPLFPNQTDFFPLQFHNGEYKISILKQHKNNKYIVLETKKVNLNLQDENILYLNSIQNIEWNPTDDSIKFALNGTKNLKTVEAIVEMFYKYVTDNLKYDFEKTKTVTQNYVPSISKTFIDSKGICYDYASLFAAFLRAKGIPTKLVKGYVNNVEGYHAWNEVLIDNKWYIIDTTIDSSMKPKVKFKESSKYKKVFEY